MDCTKCIVLSHSPESAWLSPSKWLWFATMHEMTSDSKYLILMDYNFFNRFVCVFLLLFDGYINAREDLGGFLRPFFSGENLSLFNTWNGPYHRSYKWIIWKNTLLHTFFGRILWVSFCFWFFICWISC